ncbi:MAG: 5-methylcytosine-specific restriction endonuclease system specificity protein McrC [Lachnospiraceae bacterium]|nr:5-methylcytosine-specific restriction endonuclease system specificity protein McrC [Lachnospiraceae bacterium]
MADNHKIKNIYYMLSYAYQTLRETGFDNVKAEDFENIHDLFAAILVHGVGTQIKRGLHRDYLSKEEALSGLMGQIRITETIKRQTRPQGKLVCDFDEFTENSPHNQVLKSVMRLLLRHGNVKPDNKKLLRKLLLYFNNVSRISPLEIRWDILKYHRNNASYRMLIEICRLTVEGLLLTTETGEHKLASWLNGEETFYLYQRFVFAFYKRHRPELKPSASYINWDITGEKSGYLPSMQSDIILQNGGKTIIIDTKYYGETMKTHHERAKYISGHLYQIYAYVMNYSKGVSGDVTGVLLYAKTDETITPDESMVISGNTISLKTLDLNTDFINISKQLHAIADIASSPLITTQPHIPRGHCIF